MKEMEGQPHFLTDLKNDGSLLCILRVKDQNQRGILMVVRDARKSSVRAIVSRGDRVKASAHTHIVFHPASFTLPVSCQSLSRCSLSARTHRITTLPLFLFHSLSEPCTERWKYMPSISLCRYLLSLPAKIALNLTFSSSVYFSPCHTPASRVLSSHTITSPRFYPLQLPRALQYFAFSAHSTLHPASVPHYSVPYYSITRSRYTRSTSPCPLSPSIPPASPRIALSKKSSG